MSPSQEEREFQRAMEAANELPEGRCPDPDCDGLFGHEGQHFQWVPE